MHEIKRNRGGGNFFVSVGVHEGYTENAAIVRSSEDLCVVLMEKRVRERGGGRRERVSEGESE